MSGDAATAPRLICPDPPFFWQWFRKTLRWPFLLVGGPVGLICETLARAADTVLPDIQWFVAQFNPATCEFSYVDKHGAARGLVRHFRETPDMWRRRVCAAFAWHKLAGVRTGMPKILDHYGYTGSVMINLAAEGETERWAHFRVELGDGTYGVTSEDYEVILWILKQVKPAKSVLDSITLVITSKVRAGVSIALACGQVGHIGPMPE